MPGHTESGVEALNAALDSLNGLSVAIKLVSDYLGSLRRKTLGVNLEIDAQGNLMSARVVGRDSTPLCDDQLDDIRHDCKWLLTHIESLWEWAPKADVAIAKLPRPLVEKLDALTGKPWIASARRNCLDCILKWPGERHHQSAYASAKVSGSIKDLLKQASRENPFETWEKYQELLSVYTHDLIAVRDAVQLTQPNVALSSLLGAEPPSVATNPRGRQSNPERDAAILEAVESGQFSTHKAVGRQFGNLSESGVSKAAQRARNRRKST